MRFYALEPISSYIDNNTHTNRIKIQLTRIKPNLNKYKTC